MMTNTNETLVIMKETISGTFTNAPILKTIVALLGGIFIYLFAGVTTSMYLVAALLTIDLILGSLIGLKTHTFSSRSFSRGIWKYFAYIISFFVVRILEILILGQQSTFWFNAIMVYVGSTEGISILENLIILGVELPKTFMDFIKKQSKYKTKVKRIYKRKNG